MTARIAIASLVAVAMTVGVSGAARAWNPLDPTRPVWCDTAVYSLSTVAPELGDATGVAETQRAMNDWSLVSCTSLTTSYTGRTSETALVRGDRNSVIEWLEDGWITSSSTIGVTLAQWVTGFGMDPCIMEADMALNGFHYVWTTGDPVVEAPGGGGRPPGLVTCPDEPEYLCTLVNTYSIVAHEGGHYYGLGHTSVGGSLMLPRYSGRIDSISADDQNGICALYPGSGPSDCTVTGCPGGQECVDGSCRPIEGDGSFCSPCDGPDECGGPGDFCISYGGLGFCGTQCVDDSDCPVEGSQCRTLEGGFRNCMQFNAAGIADCSAVPDPGCETDSDCADPSTQLCNTATGECDTRPTDRLGLGEACVDDVDCNSNVCLTTNTGRFCSQSCNWLDPSSCGMPGFYCDGMASGTCSPGFCLAGAPGAGANGDPCVQATDCTSRYCFDNVCAQPCTPGPGGLCDDGFICTAGALIASCGGCVRAGQTGDACETNDDCEMRNCAVLGESKFCTQFCSDASPCPDGFNCTAVVGAPELSVCTCGAGMTCGSTGTGGRDDRGCGCVAAGAEPAPGSPVGALFGVLAVVGLGWRRRSLSRRPAR